jgi:hypothetical protein
MRSVPTITRTIIFVQAVTIALLLIVLAQTKLATTYVTSSPTPTSDPLANYSYVAIKTQPGSVVTINELVDTKGFHRISEFSTDSDAPYRWILNDGVQSVQIDIKKP